MCSKINLPAGQREINKFPRFGLIKYAQRYRENFGKINISISGEVASPITIDSDSLLSLNRIEQISDFHCVTTWSKRNLVWGGYLFSDIYKHILLPQAGPDQDSKYLFFGCIDGFKARMALKDLLNDDVLLADELNGKPLTAEHGAPLRLVAPAHYGYKNAKHLNKMEFKMDESKFCGPALGFMEHPRARVKHEERGRGVPGWILRYLYRPLVRPTISIFERTANKIINNTDNKNT